jgi:hypothetical protein
VDPWGIETFSRIVAKNGMGPPVSAPHGMGAIAAIDLWATIEQMRDRVLNMARSERPAHKVAEGLLDAPADAEPIEYAARGTRIGTELRNNDS